jgi:hypothetical protein
VLAVLCGTAVWALVPVALHISSEGAAAGASHKTPLAYPLPPLGALPYTVSPDLITLRFSRVLTVDMLRRQEFVVLYTCY